MSQPDPPTAPATETARLAGALAGALEGGLLHARYQPIVAIADRTLYALEVLARLDHPRHGPMPPAAFIPSLEHQGLARPLTEAMVDQALADHAAHLAPLATILSVNFTLDVLMRAETPDWLAQRCRAAGMQPGGLIIELTESQPVAWLDRAGRRDLQTAMQRLCDVGYRLAIDDFGPEIPQRDDLFTLPFDLLKLDKSVVLDPARAPLVGHAVTQAHRAALTVVAEGVEDEATWQRMRELGVDLVQGFLVSRPLDADGVAAWRNNWQAAHAAG